MTYIISVFSYNMNMVYKFVKSRSNRVTHTRDIKVPCASCKSCSRVVFLPATLLLTIYCVYSLLLDIYYTCSKCWLCCGSELLDIFLKAFSCCVYGEHDVQAFNVLTNQFLTLKTTHREKLVNQSFHTTERSWDTLLSAFLCTLYTILCSD